MGKITSALKKAAEERLQRIEKITRIKEDDRLVIKKMGNSKVDSRLITYFDPKALITEQYKVLRTNFLSLNRGKPPKVVVLTSALHSEGKTITTLNLAIAMAQTVSKPKILLIDTPPIIAVTDAGIVGAQADAVIMVIQAGRTQRGIVNHATELLEQSHAK